MGALAMEVAGIFSQKSVVASLGGALGNECSETEVWCVAHWVDVSCEWLFCRLTSLHYQWH